MKYNKILLVDIGGTNIDIYELNTIENSLKFIKNIKSQNINLNEWISTLYINHTNYDEILCGIPGKVCESKDSIYCPPLGQGIDVKTARKNRINIVNDMLIHAYINPGIKYKGIRDIILTTSGTSIGLLLINHKFEYYKDTKYLKSYEFAHEKIIEYGLNNEIYKAIESKTGYKIEKFCSIYSVGGLAAFCGIDVDITKDGMFKIKDNELIDMIYRKEINLKLLKIWLKGLKKDLLFFFKKHDKTISKNIYLSGGLVNAFKDSDYSNLLSKEFNIL